MGISEGIMFHDFEFDGLDATEKRGIEAALNRCRALAAQIESALRNKRREHFVDMLSLADLCASLEEAANVLEQKAGRSIGDYSCSRVVKGSQAQHRHR
jgi:hypothetical protein